MISSNKIGTENQLKRDQWLKEALQAIPPGLKILDAGAGELKYKAYCSHLEYVSQDFAQYDGKGNGIGLQTRKWDQSRLNIISDITQIPCEDSSFDGVMCIEVFEHLPEPVKAIKEFARLLKPGGYLVLTAPFCSLTHFAPFHYYSGFNRYFYEKHLTESGFEIIETVANGNYFSYLAQEIRRIPDCAARYTTCKLSWYIKLVIRIMLWFLRTLEKRDSKSSELLCYGYHVFARKSAAVK